MATSSGYIDINRRFRALYGPDKTEDLAASSYTRGSFDSSTFGWHDLLNEQLVVVLGEPGSGKSWEFRQRSALLNDAGTPAFLIELGRLASEAFAVTFSHQDYARFQRWQKSTDAAYFFLDSVDESKIRRSADFYAALDKILAAIGPEAISRTKICISSRIGDGSHGN